MGPGIPSGPFAHRAHLLSAIGGDILTGQDDLHLPWGLQLADSSSQCGLAAAGFTTMPNTSPFRTSKETPSTALTNSRPLPKLPLHRIYLHTFPNIQQDICHHASPPFFHRASSGSYGLSHVVEAGVLPPLHLSKAQEHLGANLPSLGHVLWIGDIARYDSSSSAHSPSLGIDARRPLVYGWDGLANGPLRRPSPPHGRCNDSPRRRKPLPPHQGHG